ncbi:MAG: phosphopantetheine adenylyltransferase/dephospho-CoA kinase [Candidatus Azotimanducaceae bacterium]
MKVICLTGGIASGKTTANRFLEEKGAVIIDADRLGHRVYDTGTQGYLRVIEAFGEDVVDDENQIDRKILGSKVFGNPDGLKQLTDIVWPEIRRLAELEIVSYEALDPDCVVVLEAAVLFEAGWEDIGEQIWVITVEPEIAIERAMTRDGLNREAIEKRLAAQISNEARAEKADVLIENSGTLDEMMTQLEAAWAGLSH